MSRRKLGDVQAVEDVDCAIHRSGTLGLVGEHGSGKTTLGRTILQLYRPTSGHVYFDGQDLTVLTGDELRRVRRHMQIVFQDPFGSLSPRLRVRGLVEEGLRVHVPDMKESETREKIYKVLLEVGLDASIADRYPDEF